LGDEEAGRGPGEGQFPLATAEGWSNTPGEAGSFTGTVFSAAAVAAIDAASEIVQMAIRKRLMVPSYFMEFGGSFYSPVSPMYILS
jgi:hypothetical protein